MPVYVTNMDVPDTLESIENAVDQKDAIVSYVKMSGALPRFFKWYVTNDFSELQKEVKNYKSELKNPSTLIKNIGLLESIKDYPPRVQIKQLEKILSMLDPKAMMLLENCLTKDIKNYYPNIDWILFSSILGFEI